MVKTLKSWVYDRIDALAFWWLDGRLGAKVQRILDSVTPVEEDCGCCPHVYDCQVGKRKIEDGLFGAESEHAARCGTRFDTLH